MAEQKDDEIRRNINDAVRKNKGIWVTAPKAPFLTDFKRINQLGNSGQYGVTYRCQRKSDGKYFVVKHLNNNRFHRINIKHRHRYLKAMSDEIDVLQTLNHNFIIKLEDVYEERSTLYVVMEECKGGDLWTGILRRGTMNEKMAANIIKQVLCALRYMYDDNGIVHCNLNPKKILFSSTYHHSSIKIIGFGFSKVLPRLQYLTNFGTAPYYTSPEIIKNRKYRHACDMWSVGVILFIMIYGYPPFYVDPSLCGLDERKAIYEKIVTGFEPKIKETSMYGRGPWFPDDIKSSPEVKDLIGKLLQRQVRKRYTAKDALMHPWIVNGAENDNSERIECLKRLNRFHNVCQYKQMISRLFRNCYHKMAPYHFCRLEQLIIERSNGKDGMSHDEFMSAIDKLGIHIDVTQLNELHQKLQYEGDCKPIFISYDTYLKSLVYDYLIECDQRLYSEFTKLDDDNDFKITTFELTKKFKEIDSLNEGSDKVSGLIVSCWFRNTTKIVTLTIDDVALIIRNYGGGSKAMRLIEEHSMNGIINVCQIDYI